MILHTYLSILIMCLVTGIFYRKTLSPALHYILWLIIITVPVEAVGYYFLRLKDKPPGWWFPTYQIFEYALLALYFSNLPVLRRFRQAIVVSIPLVALVNIAYLFDRQGHRVLAIYSFLLSAFLVTCWSVAYIFRLFKDSEPQNPAQNSNFWVCAGLLFFYAGSFFQMGFTNIIYEQNPELAKQLYVINLLLNCILYAMITYGFVCQSKYRR